MKRRILVFCLSAILIVGMLSGCSNGTDTDTGTNTPSDSSSDSDVIKIGV